MQAETLPAVGRRELVRVSLILVALVMGFFPDVVFGGRTVLSSSTQWGVMGERPPYRYPETGASRHVRLLHGGADYNNYLADPLASSVGAEPMARKLNDLVRDGEFSLWNANMGLGRPLQAGFASDTVSPLRLALALAPTPEVWDGFLLLRLVVAGMFAYLLARRLRVGEIGATAAAVAYAFTGYSMLFINMPHVDFAMMLVIAVYAMDLLLERATPKRILLATVTVALGILSDNPRTAVVLLLIAGLYYVGRAVAMSREKGWVWVRASLIPLGVVLAAGAVLTAWVVAPFVELTQVTTFSVTEPQVPHGIRTVQPRRLLAQFLPFLEGPPAFAFGGGNTDVDNYLGISVLALAPMALWNRRAMRAGGWFFGVLLALSLAKIYGFPLVQWMGRLPLLSSVWFTKYLPAAVALSGAMLAGIAVDGLVRRQWRLRRLALVLGGLAAGLGVLLFLNRGVLATVPPYHVRVLLAFLVFVLALVAAIAVVVRMGWVRPRPAAWLMLAVITGELLFWTLPTKAGLLPHPVLSIYRKMRLQVIERPVRHDALTEPPFVSFLRAQPAPFRVFGYDRVLFPNTAQAFDIDDIRSFTPTSLPRHITYVRAFINPSLRARFAGAHLGYANSETLPPSIAGNPMVDLLNVMYVMTAPGESHDLRRPQFTLVHRGAVDVYRNNQVLPRAFVVFDVRRAGGLEAAIQMMKRPGFDPATTAVVEGVRGDQVDAGGTGTARFLVLGEDELTIDVRTDRPGLLVLSDSFYPGWVATVDGKPATIHPTDAALRGVFVPAGRSVVRFEYRARSYLVGFALTLAAAAAVGAFAFKRRRVTRLPPSGGGLRPAAADPDPATP